MKNTISTIRQYLQYLSSDPNEIFTYALFDKDSISVLQGWGTQFGKIDEIIKAVEAIPDCTLHVCLNRTSLNGRRRNQIEGVRVFCVDIDTPGKLPECDASLVVQSSPKKYHLYWKCAADISLELWSKIQLALAARYGGDFSLDEITKTIRVPGVLRRTKSGSEFVPGVIRLAKKLEAHNAESLFDSAEEFDGYYQKGLEAKAEQRRSCKRACSEFRANGRFNNGIIGISGRNNALYEFIRQECRRGAIKDEGSADAAAKSFNESFDSPLDSFEVSKTAESGFLRGVEARGKVVERLKRYTDMIPKVETEKLTKKAGNLDNGHVKILKKQEVRKPTVPFEYDYSAPYLRLNPYTENSIMERVLQRFRESLVRADGVVYAFNPKDCVWRVQDLKSAPEIGHFVDKCVLDTLVEYAEEVGEEDGAEKLIRQMELRLCAARINTVICKRVLDSVNVRRVEFSVFDSNPDLVLVGNGVLDMLSEVVRKPVASDYLLVGTRINWNAGAHCNWWKEFIGQVFKSPEMRLFIQELFGYSLSGLNSEQVIFCHFGDSCNGKSKVLEALRHIAGNTANMIAPDQIVKKKGMFTPDFERFGKKIEGRRIGIVDDIDTDTIWNEGLLKGITAKTITVRTLYKESRVLTNRCKIHMGLNKTPEPEEANDAVLRRLCLIPYEEKFEPRADMERFIEGKIVEEAEGILRWAVEGYQRYVSEGFTAPKKMQIALKEYRETSFPLANVISRLFTIQDANEWISVNDFMTELNQVLRYENKLEADQRFVGTIMKRMGTRKKRTIINGVKYSFYYIKRHYDPKMLKNGKLLELL